MSKAIIKPRMMPNMTALAPVSPDSQFVSAVNSPAMGRSPPLHVESSVGIAEGRQCGSRWL
jgi:hypothetical protein